MFLRFINIIIVLCIIKFESFYKDWIIIANLAVFALTNGYTITETMVLVSKDLINDDEKESSG